MKLNTYMKLKFPRRTLPAHHPRFPSDTRIPCIQAVQLPERRRTATHRPARKQQEDSRLFPVRRHSGDFDRNVDVHDRGHAARFPVQQHPEQYLLGNRHHDHRRLWRHHPGHRIRKVPFRLRDAYRLYDHRRTDRNRFGLHDERL